jgi:hypothetical protein
MAVTPGLRKEVRVHRIRLIGALHTFIAVQAEISGEIGLQRLYALR